MDKMKIIQEIVNDDLDSRMMIEEERIPAVYCALGKSALKKLDGSQECRCNNCRVWKENNLFSGEPPGYFCKEGQSEP